MKLNLLFKNAPDIEIEQLSIDSRLPMKNAIFFCLNGIKYDGHDFVNEAIDNGAKVIIYSNPIPTVKKAIYVKVNNVNDTLFRIADIFYNHPNNDIDEYVVSGCYGRSMVSTLIKYFLDKKSTCGYVGILGIQYNQTNLSLTFPALTALDNLKILNKMKAENIHHCVFESSPISLYYKKLDVLKPKVFVYTNTSQFCSDYKACDANYYSYLRRYLYTLEDSTYVLLNADDESYNELKDSENNIVTYGLNEISTYRISNIITSKNGTSFKINYNGNVYNIETKLLGEIAAYNITAAIACLNINGYEINEVIDLLKSFEVFDGVMEPIDSKYNVIIDCAAEQDSIKKVFEFAKNNYKGRKIAIMGINYSDDDNRIKKILKLADEYLDILYVTEDESQEYSVINILNRLDKFDYHCNVIKAIYRSAAIELAVDLLNEDDVLLILGKGSEKYMNMGLGRQYYSGDKHFVVKYLQKRMDIENETIEIY